MTGHARGYFPYTPMSVEGTYKIPESHIYNKGFSKSLSDRQNNLLPDVPYIKNWFGTRIMYSDIHINDAYKMVIEYLERLIVLIILGNMEK